MIDIAIRHKEELQELFLGTWYNEKYKFYNMSSYNGIFAVSDSSWDSHEFVSIDKNNNIIGYISYYIAREHERISDLCVINFTEDKLLFGRDIYQVFKDIFEKFNFRKISYSVIIGNPMERSYDRWTKKYGGQIIGIEREHIKLMDNKYYDVKKYELFRDDYLKSKYL